MPIKEKNNIKYFAFNLFERQSFINHCMSTRIGGVSENEFFSMNLGFNRGDEKSNVVKNYELLCDTVGLTMNNIMLPNQVHGIDVITVTKDMVVKNLDKKNFYEYDVGMCDGLITKEKNIPLATFTADCVPIFFIDTVKKIIGIAHAGWRGTVNNICQVMVNEFINEFDSNPKDIMAGIAPSINQCCFEVDEDVAYEFINKISWVKKFIEKKEKKYHINLQLINKENLLKAGILEKNIEVSPYCTVCNSELFFSHRVMGTQRGSQVSFIEII